MSLLIKNIKMPDSCINCPFSISVNFGAICCPTNTMIPDSKLFSDIGEPLGRQSYCPLIEIPKGNLIDRDSLLQEHERIVDSWGLAHIVSAQAIRNAPIIIEAEDGDEDV